jgi:hypothetical protein
MARIRGNYPGGPRRDRGDAEEGASPPRLERIEDIESRVGRKSRAHAERRRSRRVWSGFVVAVILAAGIGLYVGMVTHRTSEEITEERNDQRELQQDITRETNRVLLELWRMEDVEKQATPP